MRKAAGPLTMAALPYWLRRPVQITILAQALFWPFPAESAEKQVLRLALMPLGTDELVRTAADLLTPAFADREGIELLDRSLIDKVLQEHALSQSGLMDFTNRIQVASLLRADGLCFLKKDLRRERLQVQLVEARRGFQVGTMTYACDESDLAKLCMQIARDVYGWTNKLRREPAQFRLVSVLRIANATLRPEYGWIEDELPRLLEAYLSQDPGILVLERRQLGDLMVESTLSGEAATDFRTAGVVLDGELAAISGMSDKAREQPVALHIFLLSPNQKELSRVSVTGTLADLENLTAQAAEQLRRSIHQTAGPGSTWDRSQEAKSLVELARLQGSRWIPEAARALDAGNVDATLLLIKRLIDENVGWFYAAESSTTPLERAQNLARAAELCLALNTWEARKLFAGSSSWTSPSLFFQTRYLSDDVKEVLKPVRRLIRDATEERCRYRGFGRLLVIAPEFFFDNNSDLVAYVRSLYRKLLVADISETERTGCLFVMVSEYIFNRRGLSHYYDNSPPPEQERLWQQLDVELAAHTNMIIRYAGLVLVAGEAKQRAKNMGKTVDPTCIKAALDAADLVLSNTLDLFKPPESYRFDRFVHALRRNRDELATDFKKLTGHELPPVPERTQSPQSPAPPLPSEPGPVRGEVLLGPGSAQWAVIKPFLKSFILQSIGDPSLLDNPDYPARPGLLLLDGDNLWIASSISTQGSRGVCVFCLDLPTRAWLKTGVAVIRKQIGWHFGPMRAGWSDRKTELAAICLWDDRVCVADPYAGLFILTPTERGPGTCLLLNQDSGLPDLLFEAVAAQGDDLYIKLDSALCAWNRKTESVRMLINLRSRLDSAQFGESVHFVGAGCDSMGKYLYALLWRYTPGAVPSGIGDGIRYPYSHAIFRMDRAAGKWDKVGKEFHAGTVNPGGFYMPPLDNVSTADQVLFLREWWHKPFRYAFNLETEAFTDFSKGTNLWSGLKYAPGYDCAVPYKDGLIGILWSNQYAIVEYVHPAASVSNSPLQAPSPPQ